MNRKIILNRKIIAAIAASIMVVTLFFASMGAVTANHTADVDVNPKEMKGDSRQLIRVTVSNSEGSEDNIYRVWFENNWMYGRDNRACDLGCIIAGSTNGGYFIAAADNLSVASENLHTAEGLLKIAESNEQEFASLIDNMSKNVGYASTSLKAAPGYQDAGDALEGAEESLNKAYEDLSVEPENMEKIEVAFRQAYHWFENTAGYFGTTGWENRTSENLLTSASYLENAADNLSAGDFYTASSNFESSALALENAAEAMQESSEDFVKYAGEDLVEAASSENSASYALSDAADNIHAAGIMIGSASEKIQTAGFIISPLGPVSVPCLASAGNELIYAANFLEKAENMLKITVPPQDVFTAGDYLASSATHFDSAGDDLMEALGGDHLIDIGSDPGYLANAGDNLNPGTFDLGTAAGQITQAATQLGYASDAMASTGYTLYAETPKGWTFGYENIENTDFLSMVTHRDPMLENTDNMYKAPAFTANPMVGENTLAPGENVTLPFIVNTPERSEYSPCCDFTVYTADTGPCQEDATDNHTFELCFDSWCPDLISSRVYQSKVPENNLVGDEYDNGMATVELTFDEPVSSIGAVNVQTKDPSALEWENVKTVDVSPGENNMIYTGKFAVEEWDDNDMRVVVESATDEFGNSCDDYWASYFCVDTRAPVWNDAPWNGHEDNGLPGALDMYAKRITGRDQTPENLWATCIDTWTINGEVADNTEGACANPWKDLAVIALVNGQPVERATIRDATGTFSADDVRLGAEGYKHITIMAVDATGNRIENTVENVLLDQTPPTISGFTPEDGAVLNDNGVDVSVTVSDGGLGVENATLYDNTTGTLEKLDYKDNYLSSVTVEETVETWPEGVNKFVVKATDGLTDLCFYCAPDMEETDIVEDNIIVKENCGWFCPKGDGCQDKVWRCDNYLKPDYKEVPGCSLENIVQCYHDVQASSSFRVDVTPPNPPSIDSTCVGTACTPIATQSSWHIIAGSIDETTWEPWETYEDISVNVYAKPDGGSRSIVGEGITPDQAGYWSTEVNLSEGRNEIFVEQVDEAGNKSQITSVGFVTVDTELPNVSITAPEDGTTTSKKLITLKASVDDAQTSLGELDITISTPTRTISNPPVNEDGEIVKSIPLTEGKNTISVMVEDMAKNKNSASIAVTKTKPTNWALYAAIAAVIAIILAAIAILRRGS